MLINNYMNTINYNEMDLKRVTLKFLQKLMEKDVAFRPNATEALEDEVFCIADSNFNVDTDFIFDKHFSNGPSELDPYRPKTKCDLDKMYKCSYFLT